MVVVSGLSFSWLTARSVEASRGTESIVSWGVDDLSGSKVESSGNGGVLVAGGLGGSNGSKDGSA